ncbi:MAG: zinc-binding dehydrogenase [Acidobacteriota bacterium]
MKAMVVTRHGDESVLEMRETPEPGAKKGKLLVDVKAIGVNFADVLARAGIYDAAPPPPFIPGIEVAGRVAGVGEGVQDYAVGDRVMSFCQFGGYAEKVSVPSTFAIRLPEDMSFEEAAAFPVQYLTAYHGLHQLARVRKSDMVLVHAAAGGVGIACLQLLRHLGSKVYATVGSKSKVAVVEQECPWARTILYQEEDFAGIIRQETAGRGVDVVMDSVGGDVFRKSWDLLAPYGRHILFGAASAVAPGLVLKVGALWRLRKMLFVSPLKMIGQNRTLAGFNLFHLSSRPDILREAAEALLRLRADGAVRPRIGLSLPLEKAAEAHRRMQQRETIGKIILTLG